MGTKGLLSSFVAAFATVNIYAFCIKRDITIEAAQRSPRRHRPELPRHLRLQLLHPVCRRHRRYLPHTCLAVPFANVISTLVSPLFAAADSYAGLALIWFMILCSGSWASHALGR
ncbi:MAG: hypothetical protein ACLS3M_00245 [Collinsella sp.]